ncbi:MAG TPA: hypothetical protein VF789_27600 [Thermoanaerobaculia bacterium]
MPDALYIFLAFFAVGVPVFVLTLLVRSWWRWRGERQVSCPRDHQPARVKVDEMGAAFHEIYGEPGPMLKVCSRWPEREGCGQECLVQIKPRGSETREWRNPRPERPPGTAGVPPAS